MQWLNINIVTNIFCTVILGLMTAGFVLDPNKRERTTVLFLRLCVLMGALVIVDSVFWVLYGKTGYSLASALAVSAEYILMYCTYVQLLWMLNSMLKPLKKSQQIISWTITVLFGLEAVALIAGLFLGWNMLTDKVSYLFYIVPVFCTAFCVVSAVVSDSLHRGEKLSVALLGLLYLCGYALQAAFPESSVSYMTATLALLSLYIGIYVRRSRQLVEADSELSRKQVSLMISQMQPHFLFNSLTSFVVGYLCVFVGGFSPSFLFILSLLSPLVLSADFCVTLLLRFGVSSTSMPRLRRRAMAASL